MRRFFKDVRINILLFVFFLCLSFIEISLLLCYLLNDIYMIIFYFFKKNKFLVYLQKSFFFSMFFSIFKTSQVLFFFLRSFYLAPINYSFTRKPTFSSYFSLTHGLTYYNLILEETARPFFEIEYINFISTSNNKDLFYVYIQNGFPFNRDLYDLYYQIFRSFDELDVNFVEYFFSEIDIRKFLYYVPLLWSDFFPHNLYDLNLKMEFNLNFLLNLYKITNTLTNASPVTLKKKREASENEAFYFLSVVHLLSRIWVCCYVCFIYIFSCILVWTNVLLVIVKHYVNYYFSGLIRMTSFYLYKVVFVPFSFFFTFIFQLTNNLLLLIFLYYLLLLVVTYFVFPIYIPYLNELSLFRLDSYNWLSLPDNYYDLRLEKELYSIGSSFFPLPFEIWRRQYWGILTFLNPRSTCNEPSLLGSDLQNYYLYIVNNICIFNADCKRLDFFPLRKFWLSFFRGVNLKELYDLYGESAVFLVDALCFDNVEITTYNIAYAIEFKIKNNYGFNFFNKDYFLYFMYNLVFLWGVFSFLKYFFQDYLNNAILIKGFSMVLILILMQLLII